MPAAERPSRSLDSSRVRELFPGLGDKTFLDAACVSLAPTVACEAINEFLTSAAMCPAPNASAHHIAMDEERSRALGEAAVLLNASKRNVALVESTTHGLTAAAMAIESRLRPGDRVLVADTEFLQVAMPWCTRARSRGIEVVPVHSDADGIFRVEDFVAALDARARVLCVSSVQWCTGQRLDMEALGELCRSRSIWLIVDAVHELGALHVDVAARHADFLVAGGHKWLNAPFGCGVLYVGDRALEELTPATCGYLNLDSPPGGWQAFFETPGCSPYRNYAFPSSARTFEIGGTSNYPGAVGLGASLRLFNELGPAIVERRVLDLAARLRAGLVEAGARIVGDRQPTSGITTFRWFDDRADDLALAQRMLAERVYLSVRYTSHAGGLRVSTHFFNDESDIERLIAVLKRCVARPRRAQQPPRVVAKQ